MSREPPRLSDLQEFHALSEMLDVRTAEIPEVKVACGNCRGCCYQVVLLTPNDLKRGPWDTVDEFGQLRRREDGACIYLDKMLGCTVYDRRPEMCRIFSCAGWYEQLTPDERREILLLGDQWDKEMLASGEKHHSVRESQSAMREPKVG